jgi:hypothetical protein
LDSAVLVTDPPQVLERDAAGWERATGGMENRAAVFAIFPSEGAPYLSRTTLLRRRLERLLGPRSEPSRLLHLGGVARRVEYWPTAGRLESSLLLYELSRRYYPDDYARILKLRAPVVVKLILTNPFPRTQVTTRLSASESLDFGPFPGRDAAGEFEAAFLDFFQVRRCQEDLVPSPDHPGCMYGEMNKCLRPCQMVVSEPEYATEAARVAAFLRSGGRSLVDSLRAARDRLSEDLEFEEAARMHKRMEKASGLLQGRGELAGEVARLAGVAVTPSAWPESVKLWFFLDGCWRASVTFSLAVEQGRPVPLDRRLREVVAALPEARRVTLRERQEHLALLASWFYSSWREGEWIAMADLGQLPFRKLVNAIHRVMQPRPEPPAIPPDGARPS